MTEPQTNPVDGKKPAKRVHVETWGCQMNVADSERMLSLLADHNYVMTETAEDADLVLLNTCHIREKARHKVKSRLGRLKELKDQKPGMKIAVTGCVAQAEGRKLLKSAPYIDILLGPGKIDELPSLISKEAETRETAVGLGFKREGSRHAASRPEQAEITLSGKNEVSRYVNIQQGCNNYCTFCVVPFTRGAEISRTIDDVVAESAAMIASGAKEITLLGQNVNSYGVDLVKDGRLVPSEEGAFVDILKAVLALPGLSRLRFTTSNPHDFSKPLADLFRSNPKMGRYMHLPVQSGNDEVLARMKRKVTVAEFRQRVAWLREAIPDIALSTDLIVGFPGETEEQFEDTMKLVEETQFSFIFSFKYSPRNNTVAARMTDQIEESVKEARLARLNALQDKITIAQQEAEIGKTREVLFLYASRKSPGSYYGRTEQFRLVRVNSTRDLVGLTLPVHIEEANKTALLGSIVQ